MAEPGINKTPIMGLNMPEKGYFNWDVPQNENWRILDSLGAGRLPFMTPLVMEHKLAGEDAVGWALQGSELDGDTYVTAWGKLTEAQARATSKALDYEDITYNILKDDVTGWVFVDKFTYDKALENLKHSLGFVCDYVNGAKRIILPYKECYWKLSSEANTFGQAAAPNIKGSLYNVVMENSWPSVSGALSSSSQGYVQNFSMSGSSNRPFRSIEIDASKVSKVYKDGADLNPAHSTVYLYYRVADTAVSQNMIDLGNLITDLADVKARLEALEGAE